MFSSSLLRWWLNFIFGLSTRIMLLTQMHSAVLRAPWMTLCPVSTWCTLSLQFSFFLFWFGCSRVTFIGMFLLCLHLNATQFIWFLENVSGTIGESNAEKIETLKETQNNKIADVADSIWLSLLWMVVENISYRPHTHPLVMA